MTKKLVWRLGKLPSPDEVRELVKDKIITQEEAREILFNNETEKEVEEKDLKSEIQFLREIIDKLRKIGDRRDIEQIIIAVPYTTQPWYPPYRHWCGGTTITTTDGTFSSCDTTGESFSNITTF